MPPRDFEVDRVEEGSRLETFLRRRLGLPRVTALKAVRKGWVRVDGRRAKPDARLASGQVVRVTNAGLPLPAVDGPAGEGGGEAPAPPAADVPARAVEEARRSVRLADAALVISAKPAGAVVHAGSGHAWGWIDALGRALGGPPPVPVGRLDRDTSGLLALARGTLAARRLFDALRAGTLARTYTALVLGRLPAAEGVIDLPLEKRGPAGRERVEPASPGEGQAARSRWRVLAARGPASLVALELDTGRTHQLRAHLAARGHPILGDPRYADDAARALAGRLGLRRLFLHAGRLTLPHPDDGRPLAFDEPLPEELARPLAAL